jgi:tRNA threonylcarbamoyladenosine biosynthesis protein TsaB
MILGIDTSGKNLGFALSEHGKLMTSQLSRPGLRHGEILQTALIEFLTENNIGLASLSGIAAILGPGSFTGLRIGLAAAKGYCYSLGLPLAGISSLRAVAGLYPSKTDRLIVVADAGRKELYYAMFDCSQNTPVRLSPDSIGGLKQISELAGNECCVCGPGHLKEQIVSEIGLGDYYISDNFNLAEPAALIGEQKINDGECLELKTATPVYVRPNF